MKLSDLVRWGRVRMRTMPRSLGAGIPNLNRRGLRYRGRDYLGQGIELAVGKWEGRRLASFSSESWSGHAGHDYHLRYQRRQIGARCERYHAAAS